MKLKTTYKKRSSWMVRIVEQLNDIANSLRVKSLLPEAIDRVEYFFVRHVEVVPWIDESNRLIVYHYDKPKTEDMHPLLILPMLPMDAEIDLVIAPATGDKFGVYAPINHMVILNADCGETDRFMASVLLHEIGHAISAEVEGRILKSSGPRNEREQLEEELKMWCFDCLLTRLLGGEELTSQMDDTAWKIYQAWVKGTTFSMKAELNSPLDLCYGSVKSEKAAHRRTFIYWTYCELIALDMFFGPVMAYEHKLALISRLKNYSLSART